MNARLQSTLDDMRDALGITASDLTSDELTALVFACDRVDHPYHAINAELCERPIYVAKGIYFWPLTAGAAVWLSEYAAAWWGKSSVMYRYAQVFALMNARNADAFVRLTDRAKARHAVLRAALTLCCHAGEVTRAMNLAYGVDAHEAPKGDKRVKEKAEEDFAALVARLEVASGIPAKDWLWGRSIVSMMKSYVELTELSIAALGKHEESHIELDEAVENLARVCAAISKRVKAK